jgi:hypothetical protein
LRQNPLFADELSDDDDDRERIDKLFKDGKSKGKEVSKGEDGIENGEIVMDSPKLEAVVKPEKKKKENVNNTESDSVINSKKKTTVQSKEDIIDDDDDNDSKIELKFRENMWNRSDKWCTVDDEKCDDNEDDGLTTRILYDENLLDWIEVGNKNSSKNIEMNKDDNTHKNIVKEFGEFLSDPDFSVLATVLSDTTIDFQGFKDSLFKNTSSRLSSFLRNLNPLSVRKYQVQIYIHIYVIYLVKSISFLGY